MAQIDYEPQWIDDGSPGGMYKDRHGNTSKDGGVTWSNGYSSGGYSDPYAGGAGDFYGGTSNQPFWNEATQRTEDPAHAGRYWDSNTQQWTGGDLGDTAFYGPQQEFNQWGDVGGALAATGTQGGFAPQSEDPWLQNYRTGEQPWMSYGLDFSQTPLTDQPIEWSKPDYATEYAGEYDPKTFISEDTMSRLSPEQQATAQGRANRFATEWNARATETPAETVMGGLSFAGSGRRAADVLLPGKPGTAAYEAISDIPFVGRPIAAGLDIATAPATLATLGLGGAASAGGNVARGLGGAFLAGAGQEGTRQYGETDLPGSGIAANPWVQAGVGLGAGVGGFYGPEIGRGLARGGKAVASGLDNALTGEGRFAGETGGFELPGFRRAPKIGPTEESLTNRAAYAHEMPLPRAMTEMVDTLTDENPALVRRFANVRPDDQVTIYRAIAKNDPNSTIRPGDWIAIDRKYAEQHGADGFGDVGSRIISKKVPAKDIGYAGTSADEWVYAPANSGGRRFGAALSDETGGAVLPSREELWTGARALIPYTTRAGIGAAGGAAIAAETGNDPWKGAAIGAAAGLGTAAIGSVAKAAVERRLGPTAKTLAETRPAAATKVVDLVKAAKPIEAEQRALRSAELSKRVGKAAGMLEGGKGESAFVRSTGPLSGELPKKLFEPPRPKEVFLVEDNYGKLLLHGKPVNRDAYELIAATDKGYKAIPKIGDLPSLTPQDVTELFEHVRTSNAQYFEKLNTAGALTKMLAGELPTRSEITLLGKAFGDDLAAALLSKRSLGAKAWETFVDSVNIPRTLITAFDASAPLRQGAILFAGHPIEGAKALGTMVKAMASPKYAQLVEDAIQSSPNASVYEKMGLYFAPIGRGSTLAAREEAIMSRLAGQLPAVGGSQRGYTAFLNKIRQGVADNWIAGHPNVTEKEMAGFGHWINIASGRGDLPGILKNNTAAMNALFAPRYAMSRLQLGPEVIRQMVSGGAVRGEVARDVMAFVGTGVGVLALGKASGLWTVELDPRSTDFGKGKMGNTRFDFWAGEQQVARYATQLLTAQRKTSTGEITSANRGDVVRRWLQSKQAPYIGVASDLLTGKTFTGEKPTLGGELYERLIPLFIQDMTDAANEGVSPFRAIPAAFGAGVQTYQDSDYKKRHDFSIEKFGKPYEELDLPQREEVDREHGKYLSTRPEAVQSREDTAAINQGNLDKQQEIDQAYGKPFVLPPGESPSLTRARAKGESPSSARTQPSVPKSMKDAEAWRDNYHTIQDQAQGGREVRNIIDPFTGKPYSEMDNHEMDKARAAYFDQIDASKLGGKVDWDAVDAWRAKPENAAIEKLLVQYENDHQIGTTPMVQTYKADVAKIADSHYWDISDRVLNDWAKAKGAPVKEGQTVQEFLTETEVELRKRAKLKGLSDQNADLIASQAMATLTKDYATAVTEVRARFRALNPEIVKLLIKWGYFDPGKEETAAIIQRDMAGVP